MTRCHHRFFHLPVSEFILATFVYLKLELVSNNVYTNLAFCMGTFPYHKADGARIMRIKRLFKHSTTVWPRKPTCSLDDHCNGCEGLGWTLC